MRNYHVLKNNQNSNESDLNPKPKPKQSAILGRIGSVLGNLEDAIDSLYKANEKIPPGSDPSALQSRQNKIKEFKVKLAKAQNKLGLTWKQVNDLRVDSIKGRPSTKPKLNELKTAIEAKDAEIRELRSRLGE